MSREEEKDDKIKYCPKRISSPFSILIPISKCELILSTSSANPLRRTTKVINNLKRQSDQTDQPEPDSKRFKLNQDTALVAQHYNTRPDIDRQTRNNSPIIGLKNFNNWIKSVLFAKFARRDGINERGLGPPSQKLKVLDIGCGKGGDLNKWEKAGTAEYIGVDVAAQSVEQARKRWDDMRSRGRFRADFLTLDCYERSLSDVLTPAHLERLFDVVSMQFCMHYAFESELKARKMLENVSQYLIDGGIVIGTIPNSDNLLGRVQAVPEDAEDIVFGNEVYRIKFDERDLTPRYGHRYTFFLTDAVEEVPEYVVHWTSFVQLASEYGLDVIYEEDFHDIFLQEKLIPEFTSLLRKMNVVDEYDESPMSEDQFEACNLYKGFVLRKSAISVTSHDV